MHSTKLQRLSLIMVVGLLLSGVLACDPFGGGATKPTVTVSSPASFTEVSVGAEVEVVSTATDTKGVNKVELAVDGVLFSTEASPSPQGDTSWTLTQTWIATEPGVHNLTVTAYNVDGVASDPWGIAVRVVEGGVPGATVTAGAGTGTPAVPAATATLPPPGSTATTARPGPTSTTGAAAPTNTPVPQSAPTNTPVPPPPGQPDLVVTAINLSSDSVVAGQTVHAEIVFRNRGNAYAGPFNLLWRYGSADSEFVVWNIGGMDAGTSATMQCDTNPLYSSYTTVAIADWDGFLQEGNEGNNSLERWVTVAAPALPDLTIENLYLDPPNPGLGGYATANILIANYGSGAAGSFQVWYQWGPDIDLNVCVFPMSGGLGAGTDTWVACSVGPFLYNYDTAATVDYYLQVDESVENNNMFGLPFYLP